MNATDTLPSKNRHKQKSCKCPASGSQLDSGWDSGEPEALRLQRKETTTVFRGSDQSNRSGRDQE